MTTIEMKILVEAIAIALVAKASEVSATAIESDNNVVISLKVAKEDMGRLIGKDGRTIKAVRTILNSVASKTGTKAVLKIVENPN